MAARARIALRPAAEADATTLFQWANSADSLAVSLRSQDPIPWEHHLSWLDERLHDPRTALWIAELDGNPLGQIRLQDCDEGLVVSIYVAPAERRQGVARQMLADTIERAAQRWPGRPLIARVKHENRASQSLFDGASFQLRALYGPSGLLERMRS